MSKEELKKKLTKGYLTESGNLKKGFQWLTHHFKVNNELLQEVLFELRNPKLVDVPKIVEPAAESFLAHYNEIKDVNTGVIGDTHFPFDKEGYIDFVYDTFKQYKVNKIVHIGDVSDNHGISYHEKDPAGISIGEEYRQTLVKCHQLYKMFTHVDICIGNHDALPFRKLFTAGLPSYWLKSYQELLQSPKTWNWGFTHVINNVVYNHGSGKSGSMAAINFAKDNRCSTVIGHLHTEMSVKFAASFKDIIFGVSVGCGIDRDKYAFAYGKEEAKKQIVGCSVVLNNGTLPINIPMKF